MHLLDTMVLSEMRRREANPHVVRWLSEQHAETPTIGEIERGVERQRQINPRFGEALAVLARAAD
jgi:predicted nucleic acid-binding protein